MRVWGCVGGVGCVEGVGGWGDGDGAMARGRNARVSSVTDN